MQSEFVKMSLYNFHNQVVGKWELGMKFLYLVSFFHCWKIFQKASHLVNREFSYYHLDRKLLLLSSSGRCEAQGLWSHHQQSWPPSHSCYIQVCWCRQRRSLHTGTTAMLFKTIWWVFLDGEREGWGGGGGGRREIAEREREEDIVVLTGHSQKSEKSPKIEHVYNIF